MMTKTTQASLGAAMHTASAWGQNIHAMSHFSEGDLFSEGDHG